MKYAILNEDGIKKCVAIEKDRQKVGGGASVGNKHVDAKVWKDNQGDSSFLISGKIEF